MHLPGHTGTPIVRAMLVVLAMMAVLVALLGLDLLLPPPPSTLDPGAWSAWTLSVGPARMLMSLLRVAAIGMTTYLLAAAILHVVAVATGAAGVTRIADAVTTTATRDLLVAAFGIGLLTTAAVPATASMRTNGDAASHDLSIGPMAAATTSRRTPAPAASVPEPEPRRPHHDAPAMAAFDDAPTADDLDERPRLRRLGAGLEAPPSMRRLETPAEGTDSEEVVGPDADGAGVAAPGARDDAADRQWWTVMPGDHFWHVAEIQVAEAGNPPCEAQVSAYWRRLVDVNRDRLVDPGNADLLLPGQVLLLPSPDTATDTAPDTAAGTAADAVADTVVDR